jgi:Fe-S cluster assembly protein SufD
MTGVTLDREVFGADFAELVKGRGSDDPPFLRPIRTAAMARFVKHGFPTTRDEAWKYTNVAAIARTSFRRATPDGTAGITGRGLRGPDLGGPRLAFVNGIFTKDGSRTGAVPGVEVSSLREVLAEQPARLEAYLTRLVGADADAFVALNTAFLQDGAVVILAAGTVMKLPIELTFRATASGGVPVASYPRVLVIAEPGSEATIVETYHGDSGPATFTCAVDEVLVGENASIKRYKLQEEAETAFHVSRLAVRQERNSRFQDFSVSLGALLSRHDLAVTLTAVGTECTLDGLFYADGARHTDTTTFVDHAQPHGTSRQLYKGMVSGKGRGVFNGRVVVRPGAQKTDAVQANRNLLLSREALVDSTPQLEILADDVKCKHGSTTGQLDEAAVFYLRSRGLSEAAARSLLTYAFASDLLPRIGVAAWRAFVRERLQNRLPGAEGMKEAAS